MLIVNAALKAKAWTFEAKATGAKATGAKAEAKAIGPKAKAIKIGLEAPRGQGLASRTTSLPPRYITLHFVSLNSICHLVDKSNLNLLLGLADLPLCYQ